ncbi:MAG TPA: glycerophosphodiester phosphodiesterase family protein [Allosphingosinicella sp.]
MLAPAPERRRVEGLIPLPFAHRGLHGGGRIENSRSAFEAAIARGHGIELDVRMSRDAHAIVFHDATLERLTGEAGPVAERTAAELRHIELRGSSDTIPTLAEVLQLIGGRVPLLIEVKASGQKVAPICLAVVRSLEGYRGPVGIMSFNPEVSRWCSLHAPRLVRGLVVTEAGRRWRGAFERRLALWRARPDFLAYDVRDLPSRFAARARRRGLPVFTWTCRGEEQVKRARANADQIIYEDPA